ncbi:MAG: hypothetical protein COV30_02430 [Candidatus Yanofskybacteria bacterium CG10_big_fil_rev_8_21_14_0_10_37_15]|uniref:Uncharacterized protein n=1 Tax=Candidatus Yanofskybacteria bacterium CG10_big_fil_rev_8_21_14_0_10_37_15 TaxID=1975097 RepID=A0A2H0R777_9BACT|nr:MAG: hypothetical protein COV30_02430 [Candidatus Yanofskybacteria bacterium CG10_big_fil_rev_8_21_14_0_10_37_15]
MKKIFGIFFIIVGFLVLITPFTPGSVLLIIGTDMIFGDRWLWWKKTKKRLQKLLNPHPSQ